MTNTLTNSPTTDTTIATQDTADHDWRSAGEAWGHAAADWACLFEPYSFEVVNAIVDGCAIGSGTDVLDVACGSAWATARFAAGGAHVAGIDAAERLIEVGRDRLPNTELVHGSMFDLPWADQSFDVVTSINGIWGGCERALDEAFRVLRPGGTIGISFWGSGGRLDLRPFFFAVAAHLDQSHIEGMVETNSIGAPGAAEDMLHAAGFEPVERGRRLSVLEWPDDEIAWRALRSVGPIVPALANSDSAAVRRDVLDALGGCRTTVGTYRFENTHDFVIARKPA